jgi:uncharacterized protein (TIGR03000 family)
MRLPADAGKLTIVVPKEARVFINGHETKSTGAIREYFSRGLKSGNTYRYVVRAEIIRDGGTVEQTREIYLTTGDSQRLAIDFTRGRDSQLASTR